jgi:peptidyl-prolyl cis-trans isomerase SurA
MCLAEAKVVDKIAAIVNDDVITELDIQKALGNDSASKNKQKEQNRDQALSKLIDDSLFNQIIAKAKIEVTDDDLAKAIAGVLHQNGISIERLKEELYSKGVSYEDYKKDIEKDVKRIKFINQVIGPQVRITDQDLRDYYQKHQEEFRGSHSAHIAEIAFPLEGLATEADFLAVKDTSLSVVQQARQGKNFAELAKKYSKGPNAEKGGDLGMIDLKDLPPVVGDTIKAMKVGDVSNPILAGNTLAVVKIISLPEISAEDFDKMRDDIYAALYDERIQETFDNYIQKEKHKAYIEIR